MIAVSIRYESYFASLFLLHFIVKNTLKNNALARKKAST